MIVPSMLFRLQAPFYHMVKIGQKTVEGRLYKPKYSILRPNELIRFCCEHDVNDFVDASIKHLQIYSSFQDMLKYEGLQNCLPDVKTIEDGVKIYHNFQGYKDNEKLFGVLAIAFNLKREK